MYLVLRPRAVSRYGRLIRDLVVLCVCLWLCAAISSFAQEASKGLSKDQVIKLLKEDPAPRVQYLVNKYGIAFFITPDTEDELREAGATAEILDLIHRLAPQKPAVVTPPPAPPPPTLVIHAKPGEAEVYVDDERRGQTGTDGTLKLGNLAAGSHKLRISLAGYHSYEVNIDLSAGETNTIMAELQPNPPPAPAKEEAGAKEPAPAPIEKPHGDPNDPLTPHAPGIYYLDQTGPNRKLTRVEEAPPVDRMPHTNPLGVMGMAYGIQTVKWRSTIYGSKARLRIPSGRPVFYFYFSTTEAEGTTYELANDVFRHGSNPGGFFLVHLQMQKNTREVHVKGGVTGTIEQKDTVTFDFENATAGIYKVQVKNDMGPGEYGFLYGGVIQMTAPSRFFDFGIDSSK